MDHNTLLILAVAFLGFGLVSQRLQSTPITGPMLFAGFGLLVGPAYFDLIELQISNTALELLAEITLILVLFSDAAGIDLRQLRRDHNLPVRMLAIGMPLSIALGTVVALSLFTSLSLWEAALLVAILTPTDAALGQAVVINRVVPVRIRQALNVESGLNDGIGLPFVLIFASLASASYDIADARQWIIFGLTQVTLGPLAGIVVGYVGAKLLAHCYRIGWVSETGEGVLALALAFAAFAGAEMLHGNGFIAAFVAGLTFANTLAHKCQFVYEFAETEGQILVLATFMAFGIVMIPLGWPDITFTHVLFAAIILTVVRMISTWVALLGTGIRSVTCLFLGWFGPRGLASVLFVLLILEHAEIANKSVVFSAVMITVMLSIVLHGVTAGPGARWYGAHTAKMGSCAENRSVSETPFSD